MNTLETDALGPPEDCNMYKRTSSKTQEPSTTHPLSESLKAISYGQFGDKSFSLSGILGLLDEVLGKIT